MLSYFLFCFVLHFSECNKHKCWCFVSLICINSNLWCSALQYPFINYVTFIVWYKALQTVQRLRFFSLALMAPPEAGFIGLAVHSHSPITWRSRWGRCFQALGASLTSSIIHGRPIQRWMVITATDVCLPNKQLVGNVQGLTHGEHRLRAHHYSCVNLMHFLHLLLIPRLLSFLLQSSDCRHF